MAVPPPDNVRGAMWMLGSSLFFASVGIAVKEIGSDLPVVVIAFFRATFGILVLIPLLVRHGFTIFRTKRPGMHALRLMGSTGSILGSYYAFAHLPLAAAVSLSFTRPLFMILLAVAFMGEVVRWRRGLATVIGFAGVLIMLGPTGHIFNAAALAALAAAASISVALGVIRTQAAEEGIISFLAWYAVGTVVIMAPVAALGWQTPHGMQWVYLFFIGLASTGGQFFIIKAFSTAEATVVAPVDYLQIIIAATMGFLLFGEIPTIWTVIGAAIIVTSTLYIVFREARLKKLDQTPPADK